MKSQACVPGTRLCTRKRVKEVRQNESPDDSGKQGEVHLHELSYLHAEEPMGGVFCATGKSEKTPEMKGCNCPGCQVYTDYDLKGGYFCIRGAAD